MANRKKDPQDPGPVPGEAGKPRRLMVGLPLEIGILLRKVSAKTGYTIGDLILAIEGSPELPKAAAAVLQAKYNEWRQSGDELFKEPVKPILAKGEETEGLEP